MVVDKEATGENRIVMSEISGKIFPKKVGFARVGSFLEMVVVFSNSFSSIPSPPTNAVALAYMNGIFGRVMEPFCK